MKVEEDEIKTKEGSTPVPVPNLQTEGSGVLGDSTTSLISKSGSSRTGSMELSMSPAPNSAVPKIKGILKVTPPADPLPPPPPPKFPTGDRNREEISSYVSASDVKVDLKQFAKSTVQSFKRASKAKLGSQSSERSDDSSVFSDMEDSMTEEERQDRARREATR